MDNEDISYYEELYQPPIEEVSKNADSAIPKKIIPIDEPTDMDESVKNKTLQTLYNITSDEEGTPDAKVISLSVQKTVEVEDDFKKIKIDPTPEKTDNEVIIIHDEDENGLVVRISAGVILALILLIILIVIFR